ncbi:hypothetical protein CEXT_89811 [Caerostris extrusa]|uniref:Uncharacterized protein n=1 Tax=Caerostris extrusa TaxID=172846 RepID=A0AAV4X2Z1_CAEEX|nr:hypothetical protein CEXT_89811 [Caerostris extrusa]
MPRKRIRASVQHHEDDLISHLLALISLALSSKSPLFRESREEFNGLFPGSQRCNPNSEWNNDCFTSRDPSKNRRTFEHFGRAAGTPSSKD